MGFRELSTVGCFRESSFSVFCLADTWACATGLNPNNNNKCKQQPIIACPETD